MTTDFPAEALPYGVFSGGDGRRRLGVGLGRDVVDLDAAAGAGAITAIDPSRLTTGSLNSVLAGGRAAWEDLRAELLRLCDDGRLDAHRVAQSDVALHLAWDVGDYVDFYSSHYHAENVGRMLRQDVDPILPNWLHQPVGYHGRTGTIVVDGTPIRRPAGQRQTADGDVVFGPTERLDIELEIGFVLGGESGRGEGIPIEKAADHLFGVVLLNDWSARDIQAWEFVPLGPFLGKSFATSVSAWVMPMQALEAARVHGPEQVAPEPLPYLRTGDAWSLSLDLEVWLRPAGAERASRITSVNAGQALYWNAAQQLAHMTVNGATVRPGDLFGSGTVSGPEPHQRGCLLELTWSGQEPIDLEGITRRFLEDGDEVTLQGWAPGPSDRIPLGPVTGIVEPH